MKTVIRNSYTPKLGDYCETIVVDRENERAFIFDQDGVFTEIPQPIDVEDILRRAAEYTDSVVEPINEKLDTIEEGAQVNKIEHVLKNGTELTITNKTVNVTVPVKTSDLTNDGSDGTDTYVESATLGDYYTKTETDTQIGYETDAREIADAGLQEQIDAIVASSDVVDIVGTYAALQAYDTSKLHDNDIIKVLDDETRDDATTYYRWDADTSTWGYIGAEGPFYTKAESDAIFTPMTRTINGNALSSDITLTAADVHALPDSTVIPTVNDATLTIQKNGTTVQTFTANQSTNATANITVPTDTSDLTNGAGFITSAALPTKTSDLTNDGEDGTDTYAEMGDLPTKTSDLTNDGSDGTSTYVEADELGAAAFSNDYTDLDNKPTIPTVNDATLTIQKNGTNVATFTANSSTNQTANITVPTDTLDLTNGAGFITTAALSDYYTKNETYSQQEVNSLISAITVPTKTSDLTNDGSTGTSTYVETSALGAVAFSNDYNDLTNKPTIPSYSDFTGATASTAGAHGLVPAPAAGDQDKYLKADGTWATVQGGGSAVSIFYADPTDFYGATGWENRFSIYSDDMLTTAITGQTFEDAYNNGGVQIRVCDAGSSTWDTYDVVGDMYNADEDDYDTYTLVNGGIEEGYDAGGPTIYTLRTGGYLTTVFFIADKYDLQQKLTAGTNITISNNTISASIPIDSALDVTSTNPVQNSVVTAALNNVQARLVEMSYGESNAWAKFIAAYNAGSIVYCRASSNANPATGSQTRKAFMAYVNNADNPTNVEFQYVRSVSSKTDSQQCDQVFVYTLTNASGGTWSVASRNMSPKVNVSGPITKTFSNGANATVTIGASTMTGATGSAAGAAGVVPAPAATDNTKFLRGDGTWATAGGGMHKEGVYLFCGTVNYALYGGNNITYDGYIGRFYAAIGDPVNAQEIPYTDVLSMIGDPDTDLEIIGFVRNGDAAYSPLHTSFHQITDDKYSYQYDANRDYLSVVITGVDVTEAAPTSFREQLTLDYSSFSTNHCATVASRKALTPLTIYFANSLPTTNQNAHLPFLSVADLKVGTNAAAQLNAEYVARYMSNYVNVIEGCELEWRVYNTTGDEVAKVYRADVINIGPNAGYYLYDYDNINAVPKVYRYAVNVQFVYLVGTWAPGGGGAGPKVVTMQTLANPATASAGTAPNVTATGYNLSSINGWMSLVDDFNNGAILTFGSGIYSIWTPASMFRITGVEVALVGGSQTLSLYFDGPGTVKRIQVATAYGSDPVTVTLEA